ncbi:MAG: flagellar biosynthesis protein FlhA [bacterium]|nr:flagellar biosynthesis protein FlhA [bacterium]
MKSFSSYSDVILAVAVVGIIGVLIIPVPTGFLDLLLAANISLSLVILLSTLYLKRPLEFSVFPGLLLVVTLFRLSLNVASTRLILGEGYAGAVIDSFGNFVVKGNYVVGFIIFIILVVIQFVVITKGAGRISEVAARFTLDAMPGKQMAIDADLNAGLINDDDARRRRSEITKEADFYGAMDGASKFVRGDAVAGILITLINVIGGFIIGMAQEGLPLTEALRRYTLLSIGDGLVTQIPALIVATASGILVTRAAGDSNLGSEMTKQMTLQPKALAVASAIVFLLGIVPGMPFWPFSIFSILVGVTAYMTSQAMKTKEIADATGEVRIEPEEHKTPTQQAEESLHLDTLELEIGYGLIPLVDVQQGGDLLERISTIRRQLAQELGVIVPPIRIRDNVQLKPNLYEVKLKGNSIARFELMVDHLLAINPGYLDDDIDGFAAKEPAFGMSAKWIIQNFKELAEMKGYTVVEPAAVMATHITELIKIHAAEIFTRQDVKNLVDRVKKDTPAAVEDVVGDIVPISTLEKVLQNLLSERISMRDIVTILESLAEYSQQTKDADVLTEYVRMALRRTITHTYAGTDGTMSVFTLEPRTEKFLSDNVQATKQGLMLVIQPANGELLTQRIAKASERMSREGNTPLLLVSPNVRMALHRYLQGAIPNLVVVSYSEILPQVEVFSKEAVSIYDAN